MSNMTRVVAIDQSETQRILIFLARIGNRVLTISLVSRSIHPRAVIREACASHCVMGGPVFGLCNVVGKILRPGRTISIPGATGSTGSGSCQHHVFAQSSLCKIYIFLRK
jgi:hypothetical protein